MNRREFAALSLSLGLTAVLPPIAMAHEASPEADLEFSTLDVEMTDTGFVFPETVAAGRTLLRVTNTGTMTESHWALGRFPDDATEAMISELITSDDNEETALQFEDIAFVGVPDWPKPGGLAVTGIVDLHPGRYIAFDPISGRSEVRLEVTGEYVETSEPLAEVEVDLHEMVITIPETAFTSDPVRWKITNTGTTLHDVAVLAVPAGFTADDFMALLMLPEDATPSPDMKVIEYQPVAAIGILGLAASSWLDVQLEPGHYMGVCMLPFATGYPHAMDGMYVFFEVA
jgi:hypothetical protein